MMAEMTTSRMAILGLLEASAFSKKVSGAALITSRRMASDRIFRGAEKEVEQNE